MFGVKEALNIVLDNVRPLPGETVSLQDAFGRVLREDIASDSDIPLFDNSAMDGYAVISADVAAASEDDPVELDIAGDVRAGDGGDISLTPGMAVKIMTGAPVPRGADSVVMKERAESAGDRVKIFEAVRPGRNIRRRGEDLKKGELVLKKGAFIGPAEMGIIASCGRTALTVTKTPRIAIIATGDELIPPDKKLGRGLVRNTNSYSLHGQVRESGALPVVLGIARDKKSDIEEKIRKGLESDVLIISGGVSVGDYDYVKDVLSAVGAEIRFWKVAMRPGKPVMFAAAGGTPVFGLPGNPVSSMVAFEVFVRPAVLKMLGQEADGDREVDALLEEDIKKKRGLRYFLRARTVWKGGAYYTRTTGPQGSGILKSMLLANSLIVLPEEKEGARSGERVKVRFLK